MKKTASFYAFQASMWLIIMALAIALTACNDYGKKLTFKKGEVYFKGDITEKEAQKLGDYLLGQEYFDDQTTKSVQLIKKDGNYVCRFVVDKNKVTTAIEEGFKLLKEMISVNVFEKKKTIIELCDEKLVTVMVIGD
jgi:hypothetical protein